MANHLSLKTPNREKHTYLSIIFIYFQSEKRWRGASLIKRIKIGGKALKKKFPLYFFNNFHIIFFLFTTKCLILILMEPVVVVALVSGGHTQKKLKVFDKPF